MSKHSKVLDMLRLGCAFVQTRLLNRPMPLFVGWNITLRCNLHCQYCGARDANDTLGRELTTDEVMTGLRNFWNSGIRWITFSGGEPLVRKDMPEILHQAHTMGFTVFLSTNGWLLPAHESILSDVDHVNLSLDGDRETHDVIRGAGAFEKTIAAVELCQKHKTSFSFQCVLSSINLKNGVEEVLAIAERYRTTAMFQPATLHLDSSTGINPIAPPVDAYHAVMEKLIRFKQAGRPVRNSIAGLKHLANWPKPTPIWCSAGLISFEVEPDGSMLACHQVQFGPYLKQHDEQPPTVAQAVTIPAHPVGCTHCWCAPLVEMGLVFSLSPSAVWNAFRQI